MKNGSQVKKILSIFMVLIVTFSLIIFPGKSSENVITAKAANITLNDLKSKFPQDYYWNHYVSNSSEAYDSIKANGVLTRFDDCVSQTQCANHSGSYSYSWYIGKYDCNRFNGGSQCCGFAQKIASYAYGSSCTAWNTKKLSDGLKPGDVIHYYGDGAGNTSGWGHWVMVISVNGNTIGMGECNWSGRCRIRWDRTTNVNNFSSCTVYSAPWTLSTGTHAHNYVTEYEAAHPHKEYRKCYSCGDWSYTGNTIKVDSCSICNHVHNYAQYFYQPEHPHRVSVRCSDYDTCGSWKWTNDYRQVKSCKDCWTCSWDTNTTSVSVTAGQSTSFYLKVNGFLPSTVKSIISYDKTLIDVAYSNDNKTFLVTGKKAGSCQLRISVYSDETLSYTISSKTINVTVVDTTYTISYNANGGTNAPTNQTKHYGTDLTITSSKPTGKTFTVSFNGNGGSISTTSKKYTQIFNGWNTNSSGIGTNYSPGSIYINNSSATLYAKWTTPSLGSITKPTKSGMYFAGWYDSTAVNEDGLPIGNMYTSSSRITSNITLYAMWSKSPTLLFGDCNLDGEIDFNDIQLMNKYRLKKISASSESEMQEILFRCDLNRNGELDEDDMQKMNDLRNGNMNQSNLFYDFLFFGISHCPETIYTHGEPLNLDNLEVMAVFRNLQEYDISTNLEITGYDPYKIGTQTITVSYYQYSTTYNVTVSVPKVTTSFDANGGSVSTDNKSIVIGENYGSLPSPVRSGYTFIGWFTEPIYGTEITSGNTCQRSNDHILYAHWVCNHNYVSTITTAATCTSSGVRTYSCLRCGDSYIETIKVTNHIVTYDKAVAPTCTTAGKTQGSHCSKCNAVITSQQTVNALSHSFGSWATTNTATCTAEGSEKRSCSRCNTTETRAISKTGHTVVTDKAVDATCTTAGKTQGSHCSNCNTVITAQQTISATGKHADNDHNGKCDSCGKTLDPTVGCSCNCHKGGFQGFIFKIILFFQKIFKTNKVCQCGVNHY